MIVLYDAGVLVAAERNDRAVWADHRARLELGRVPVTSAPVVAQVSRTAKQVQLRRFLRGCRVRPFTPAEGHDVGAFLAKAGGADVVDAHLMLIAEEQSTVLTSDPEDLQQLAAQLGHRVRIRRV
jgi:hypothetical protein